MNMRSNYNWNWACTLTLIRCLVSFERLAWTLVEWWCGCCLGVGEKKLAEVLKFGFRFVREAIETNFYSWTEKIWWTKFKLEFWFCRIYPFVSIVFSWDMKSSKSTTIFPCLIVADGVITYMPRSWNERLMTSYYLKSRISSEISFVYRTIRRIKWLLGKNSRGDDIQLGRGVGFSKEINSITQWPMQWHPCK